LLENLDKINFYDLIFNKSRHLVVDMIKRESAYYWNYEWDDFLSSVNTDDSIQILTDNRHRANCNWAEISNNTNGTAAELLRLNPDKINNINLSNNRSIKMLMLLKEYPQKICWRQLSINPSELAVDILLQNPDKTDKINLSLNKNPRVLDFFLKYPHKIEYSVIFKNPAIFVIDYEAIKRDNLLIKEELVAAALHPRRIERLLDSGVDVDDIDYYL
jgi:hypothetical protein